jgi:hypothetical protein
MTDGRWPSELKRDEIKRLQRELNSWVDRWLLDIGPLKVDGDIGPATKKRIRQIKYFVGYTGDAQKSTRLTPAFARRRRHPRDPRYAPLTMIARGIARRRAQKKAAREAREAANHPTSGVSSFDGRPCAAWMRPYLVWARQHGWKGTLVSGWRDPAYSERLCFAMCGAPSCPGRCAGRASNHAGSVKPAGALDVSDYYRFGQLMRECPYSPRIFNALGAQDPVHFSASGR